MEAPEPARPELPEKRATVVCAEDQLSLAIGRSGQNVRLASKLTGYRIDLVSKADYLAQEEAALFGRRPELAQAPPEEEADEEFALADIPGIDAETAAALAAGGYRTFDDIINLEHDELAAIPGIGPETSHRLGRCASTSTPTRTGRTAPCRRGRSCSPPRPPGSTCSA